MTEKDCIFCKIVSNSLPCYMVWENSNYLAFLSIFPNTRGVTVVAPKKHQTSYIFDQENDDISGIMLASKEVAKILTSRFDTAARVGVVFEGFGINHLHAKLFPLHGTKGEWQQISSTIKTKFDTYPGYISSHDADMASHDDLKLISDFLKND